MSSDQRLGIGFIGSGFITRFHIDAWQGVRHADVRGVWSPNRAHAEEAAALAREKRVGTAQAYDSISDMVAAPAVDAIWICGPNHTRIENMEAIVRAVQSGTGDLTAIACEKPLARTVAEADRMVELVEDIDVLHGYLEDQLFSPGLQRGREIIWERGAALTGRPYLARAAEEHSGPHAPWFWQGDQQGGGVLNDMMCHSVEVARFLLTEPGAPRDSIRPTKVSAQIASLKWSRDEYAERLQRRFGSEVDYKNRPSEDFARATIEYEDEQGRTLVSETTTSWCFVGAGLRLRSELLGPEYAMEANSLQAETEVFFSREVEGAAGEDLVEKQNAEQGLMPVVGDEAATYGYTGENRHFVRRFLDGTQPDLDFHSGREVTELLMTAYMSAEQEQSLAWKPEGLRDFVPDVQEGTWNP
ncbi:MAG: Gfo/Idh/MocA family protein [Salinibacter sp.]|uniref:Gfo/Idh/MocA family protein n=1 Tax=Salinibacter sp. TaxID=2065818 RepID=UPI0035D4E12E